MTICSLDIFLFLFGTSLLFHVRFLTVASWPAYRFLKRQVRWSGIPISFRISHSLLWSTQSKALAYYITTNSWWCWFYEFWQLYKDIKNPPAMQETQVWSLGQKNPLEKGMVIHAGILAWEIHGQRSLVGYSSWGEWLTHTHIHHYNIIGKSFTTLELLILQSVHPFLPLTQPLAITNLFTVSI